MNIPIHLDVEARQAETPSGAGVYESGMLDRSYQEDRKPLTQKQEHSSGTEMLPLHPVSENNGQKEFQEEKTA